MDIAAVERDLEQIWAQATHEFLNGKRWWFETGEDDVYIAALAGETDSRYLADAIEDPLRAFLEGQESTSVSELLRDFMNLPKERWDQVQQNRLARALVHMDWVRYQARLPGGGREWRYRRLDTGDNWGLTGDTESPGN